MPFSLEYWHMGETKMRFLNVMVLKRKVENNLDIFEPHHFLLNKEIQLFC